MTHLDETRAAYDTVAADYAEQLKDQLASKPSDRAILAAFAELVAGPVLDVGCGPGHVTAHLRELGVATSGVDLSPRMVAVAREAYPDIRFEVGSMTALDVPDASLGGIVAWYSIIHTPPESLPAVFAEFRRALAPGGVLLLAFQVGDERRHIEHGYGHDVSLDAWRLRPDAVESLLERFDVISTTIRQPDATEKVPQAYLIARAPFSDQRA